MKRIILLLLSISLFMSCGGKLTYVATYVWMVNESNAPLCITTTFAKDLASESVLTDQYFPNNSWMELVSFPETFDSFKDLVKRIESRYGNAEIEVYSTIKKTSGDVSYYIRGPYLHTIKLADCQVEKSTSTGEFGEGIDYILHYQE